MGLLLQSRACPRIRAGLAAAVMAVGVAGGSVSAKEFLTPEEITKIQDAREIDKRIKIYMEAASLRLKTAEGRLSGQESAPGEPLEFYSVEEMLDGYYRIFRGVMHNLDDASQDNATDRGKLNKAMKQLKESSEKAVKDLEVLKRIAEEKKNAEVWNLVGRALEITEGAHEGAELGLSRFGGKAKQEKQ